jgi:hypothetical protein
MIVAAGPREGQQALCPQRFRGVAELVDGVAELGFAYGQLRLLVTRGSQELPEGLQRRR